MGRWTARLLALCLSLVLSLGLASPALAAAEKGQSGSIGGVYETHYESSGQTYEKLAGYNPKDPDTYSDSVRWTLAGGILTISGSGTTADFYGTSPFEGNSDIEVAVVEKGVTSLGVNMFEDMPNLKAVILMDASTRFENAFADDFPSLEAILVGANLEGGTYTTPNLVRAEALESKILPLTHNVLLKYGMEKGILPADGNIDLLYGGDITTIMKDGTQITPTADEITHGIYYLITSKDIRFISYDDILSMAREIVQDLPGAVQDLLPDQLTSGSTLDMDATSTEEPGQTEEPVVPETPEGITETTQSVSNGLTHLRTSYSENDYLDLSLSGSTLTVSGRIVADGLRQIQVTLGSGAGNTVSVGSGAYFSIQLKLTFSGSKPLGVYTNRGGGSTFSSYTYDRIYIQQTAGGYQIMPSLILEQNQQYNESYVYPQSLLEQEVPDTVAAMSDQIVGSETDPYTQVFLLHQWVAKNISYDYTMLSGAPRVTDSAGVLELRRSVCQGYAELLRDLILAQGIPAMTCTNDALYGSYALTTSGGESHAHTEAYVNGRWVVMDPTWDSRNKYYGAASSSNKQESPNGYFYFDITPEAFALDHKITSRGGTWHIVSDGGFLLDPEDPTRLIGYVGPAGKVVVPAGITTIGESAFSPTNTWTPASSGITEIVLPDSVTTIENTAFYKCTDLTSVTLPEGLRTLGSMVFGQCTSLRSIQLPDTLTAIGREAFSHSGLTSITIPDSVVSIGELAFTSCPNLQEITIPGGVQIGAGILASCSSLRRVVLEEGAPSIPTSTFYNCPALTELCIPSSVTSVGNAALYGCTALKDVYYGGSQQQWTAVDIGERNTPLSKATFHWGTATQEEETGEKAPIVNDWAETNVQSAADRGLIPDGVLGADYTAKITRAQFAALAVHTYEHITGDTVSVKTGDDVFADSTGNPYLAKAYNLGIIKGYNTSASRSAVKVGPDDSITREQAATMLARLSQVLGKPLSPAPRLPFTDAISHWAYDSVCGVYQAGIMNGTSSVTFSAQGSYTIEQAITTMYRCDEWVGADA